MDFQGLSGGIFIVRKLGVAIIDVFHQYQQEVAIVIFQSNDFTWFLSAIYASTDYRKRRFLWKEMTALIDERFLSIIASDFNYIDGPEERGGQPFMEATGSNVFGKFLHSNGLVDIGFLGPRFT